jgi:hypothetical protein
MYDAETGQRLLTPEGAGQVWLQPLRVGVPPAPPPLDALGMQHAEGTSFGELALLGYDAHKLGFAHQPETALRPGDTLHLTLYWQALLHPSGDWQLAVDLVRAGGQSVHGFFSEPVPGYPTSVWEAGDVWRGQFHLVVPADAPTGRYRLQVEPIAPDGRHAGRFSTQPLRIEP